jgi:hypothetical protein
MVPALGGAEVKETRKAPKSGFGAFARLSGCDLWANNYRGCGFSLTTIPFCGEWEDELRSLFAGYVEAKQKQPVI